MGAGKNPKKGAKKGTKKKSARISERQKRLKHVPSEKQLKPKGKKEVQDKQRKVLKKLHKAVIEEYKAKAKEYSEDRRKIKNEALAKLGAEEEIKAPPDVAKAAKDLASGAEGDVQYELDDQDRPALARGNLVIDPESRGYTPTPIVGKKAMVKGVDDKGHLVAVMLVGRVADNKKNIVPENSIVNQQYKRGFEDAVRLYKDLHPKKQVTVIHKVYYNGDESRPARIEHYAAVDGVIVAGFGFDNPTGISMR